MSKPVMLVKFCVEASSVAHCDPGNPQARQPRISHPQSVAPGHRLAPLEHGNSWSGACIPDYEKALGPLTIGYFVGAGVMIAGGIIAWFFGVNAERRSLEDIARPLSASPILVLP